MIISRKIRAKTAAKTAWMMLLGIGLATKICRADGPSNSAKPTNNAMNSANAATDAGDDDDPKVARDLEKERVASSQTVRDFSDVLQSLITEFAYDLKMGQIPLTSLSIRRVEVSESIPSSYAEYIELLVAEQIHANTNITLINCLPCHSKATRLLSGKLVVTSPNSNLGELKTAAEQLGIAHFMDVMLIYNTTHMILAFQIFKADTKETIWAKSYNSEQVRSRYQGLAIDYSQVKKSRSSDEYVPEYRALIGFGAGTMPNLSHDPTDNRMLTFSIRGVERFDNRHSDFGLQANVHLRTNAFLTQYPTENTITGATATTTTTTSSTTPIPKPFTFALGIFGLYAHNFLGSVESYNEVRQGIAIGAGGLMTPGYLAASTLLGWDIFFGRRFAVTISGVYVSKSQLVLATENMTTPSGIGYLLVMSVNF